MIADFESLREMLGGLLAQVCLSALLLIVCGIAIAKLAKATGRPLGELWRKSRALFAALALLACCATLDAQKTNGVFKTGLTRLTGLPGEFSSVPLSQNPVNPVNSVYITGDDIARGYRQESTTTNDEPFAEMPPNAVEYAQWARRGGRETSFPLDLGGFVFPLGTNRVTRFDVLSGGAVEPLPCGTSAAICAAREYASLVPGVSRFWSADAEDGAKVLRWDRVFANRDRTGEYTAEMRFFQNGDFTTRSNEVETVYRRVNPDDFDGDGIANDIDADPLFCDGDFYGVANALPSNANENAYYWLDLSVTGLLDCATIRVTCDGPSDLGDHMIIARANRVCHIPLLAGATYAVESDLPIGCSEVSAEYAEIATNSETSLTVRLPVQLSFETGGSGDALTSNFIFQSAPVDVGAALTSITGGCCLCELNGTGFTWTCSEECECRGSGHALSASATWEGYTRIFDWWGTCSCDREEPGSFSGDGVGLSIGMPSTLIANDDDDNDDGSVDASPPFASADDDIVTCTVSFTSSTPTNGTVKLQRLVGLEQGEGGDRKVYADRSALAQIEEGHEYRIMNSSEETWENLVNPVVTSSHYLDGQVRALWKPEAGPRASASKRFTIIEPTVEPITDESWSIADFAGDGRLHSYLYNPCGIAVGKTATFKVDVLPEDYPDSEIIWTTNMCEGAVRFVGSNVNTGRVVTVEGKSPGFVFLEIQIGDSESMPALFMLKVTEESSLKLRAWIIGNDGQWPTDEANISNMVAVANDIYSQVGINIDLVGPIVKTNIPNAYSPTIERASSGRWQIGQVVSLAEGTDGLECYFVDSFFDQPYTAGVNCPSGMVLSAFADGITLAHEIGHVFNLCDIYVSNVSDTNDVVSLRTIQTDERPKAAYMMSDWNGGCEGRGTGGVRYYRKDITHAEVIERMLMNGCGGSGRDISFGLVHGIWYSGNGKHDEDWHVDLAPVGFWSNASSNRSPVHQ